MSVNQGIVDFTSKATSLTVTRSATGLLVTSINVEGSSKAYGPFVGTVTVTGSNKGGMWHYEAFALPADGSNLTGTAQGSYEAVSGGRWKTVGVGAVRSDSAVQNLRLEAEFDLENHTWNGKLVPI